MSYLGNLTLRLAAGAMRLEESLRARHGGYLARAQNSDGGFSGRQGPSDLYYTGFALRALALVGQLDVAVGARAAAFLQSRQSQPMSSVERLSWAASAILLEAVAGIRVSPEIASTIAAHLDTLRRPDGGYARTASGASSTYHTFLAATSLELLGLPLPQPECTARFVRTRRREDGGFAELAPMRDGGTNPTAAAVGLLRLLGALDEETVAVARRFLSSQQTAEGGLRANTRIPVADLLSTFTGLVALGDLDACPVIDLRAAQGFARQLECAEGGFRGAAWDAAPDVEYTFYGLGLLAFLATVPGHEPELERTTD